MNNVDKPNSLPYTAEEHTPKEHLAFYMESQIRNPSFFMPYEHSHKIPEFYYLRKGQCIYVVNSTYVRLAPGDCIILPAGIRHSTSYSGEENSERISVYINESKLPGSLFTEATEVRELLSTPHKISLDRPSVSGLEDILLRMSKEQFSPSAHSQYIMSLYVSEMLILLASRGKIAADLFIPTKNIDTDIERAIYIISTEYASPTLSLTYVAASLGLNASYFSHKFKASTGFSFTEYVNNIRIRNAAQRLMVTDDTITKIALSCGFNSSNYFKDIFRKQFNCSPREYRNRSSVSSKFGSGQTID